jgi:uncharacterized membrane protein YccC
MTTIEREPNTAPTAPQSSGEIVLRAVVLSISCAISNWLTTHLLASAYSISREDDLLGGMWAVVSTIFVYRQGAYESASSALSRMAATLAAIVLCLAYLWFFPFHVWGMAALIGIGIVAVTLMGRPEDAITTGITIAVIMVVAELNPHDAWRQPILRLADTAIGVVVGLAAVWLCPSLPVWRKRSKN